LYIRITSYIQVPPSRAVMFKTIYVHVTRGLFYLQVVRHSAIVLKYLLDFL